MTKHILPIPTNEDIVNIACGDCNKEDTEKGDTECRDCMRRMKYLLDSKIIDYETRLRRDYISKKELKKRLDNIKLQIHKEGGILKSYISKQSIRDKRPELEEIFNSWCKNRLFSTDEIINFLVGGK